MGKNGGLVMLFVANFCCDLGPLVPLEKRVTVNQYVIQTNQLYLMMKHFSSDGSGLFQDDSTPSTWHKRK